MKPVVGTDLRTDPLYVGFLGPRRDPRRVRRWPASFEHKAPQIVAIDPGHDGWVVGKEPVGVDRRSTSRATRSAGLACRPSIGTKKGRRKKVKKEGRKKKEEVHLSSPLRATKTSADPGSSSECSNGTDARLEPDLRPGSCSHSPREKRPSTRRTRAPRAPTPSPFAQ